MLGKWIRERLRNSVHKRFRRLLRNNLPIVVPGVQGFFPHDPHAAAYVVPRTAEKGQYHPSSPFPVPPLGDIGSGWYKTVDEYLASGRENIQALRQMLGESGTPMESLERILDFGCCEGRMIRWLVEEARSCEIWGTDVGSSHVLWCQQHLSPPFHFATTTLHPHLPFEDHYFGLVFAGSVFTHIDDLAAAWFLELRRIIRPGGRLYITIHDRHTIHLLDKDREITLNQHLRPVPEYGQYVQSDFGMFTIGRWTASQVFYDRDFLCKKLEPIFRLLSVRQEAYGYQSALLLERR